MVAVHPGVDFVEAVGADESGGGTEVRVDAERVALAVEIGQRDDDRHQPRRRDHLHRARLAREDLGVDRVNHRVEPSTRPHARRPVRNLHTVQQVATVMV